MMAEVLLIGGLMLAMTGWHYVDLAYNAGSDCIDVNFFNQAQDKNYIYITGFSALFNGILFIVSGFFILLMQNEYNLQHRNF